MKLTFAKHQIVQFVLLATQGIAVIPDLLPPKVQSVCHVIVGAAQTAFALAGHSRDRKGNMISKEEEIGED